MVRCIYATVAMDTAKSGGYVMGSIDCECLEFRRILLEFAEATDSYIIKANLCGSGKLHKRVSIRYFCLHQFVQDRRVLTNETGSGESQSENAKFNKVCWYHNA